MSSLNNVIVRFSSCNRTGTVPNGTKSPKIYLTLGGTATAQKLYMRALPDVSGPTPSDAGMQWFLTPLPTTGNEDKTVAWTLHCQATGAGFCLERIDTKTGELRMNPVKGKPTPSQTWYLRPSNDTKKKDCYDILERKADEDAPLGAPPPARLDVSTGTDSVVARSVKGSPINPANNKPFGEGTVWEFVVLRGARKEDDAGTGWASVG